MDEKYNPNQINMKNISSPRLWTLPFLDRFDTSGSESGKVKLHSANIKLILYILPNSVLCLLN